MSIRKVDLNEAKALVERGDVTVIEVLPQKYYDAGHLPGAIWSTTEDVVRVAAGAVPHRDATVLLYCASETCRNSDEAAAALAVRGYTDLAVFTGGKAAWKEAGLPLESAVRG